MRGTPCDLYGPPESYAEVARSEQTTSPLAGEGWDEGDSGGPRGPPESYAKSPSYDPGPIKEVKLLYEYRVYEAMPGKLDELHARFRDHTLKLFEKHGIRNIGYWTVDVGDANDRLIYIVAFEDAADRERAWASFGADPEWHRVVAESEANGKLVARILNSTLTPTDYSQIPHLTWLGAAWCAFRGCPGVDQGVTHDMIGHRTGSRVPSLRVSAAVRCQLWLFSGQRRHGRAWQLGRVAYKPMLQAGSPMLDTARQPAPISSAAP